MAITQHNRMVQALAESIDALKSHHISALTAKPCCLTWYHELISKIEWLRFSNFLVLQKPISDCFCASSSLVATKGVRALRPRGFRYTKIENSRKTILFFVCRNRRKLLTLEADIRPECPVVEVWDHTTRFAAHSSPLFILSFASLLFFHARWDCLSTIEIWGRQSRNLYASG